MLTGQLLVCMNLVYESHSHKACSTENYRKFKLGSQKKFRLGLAPPYHYFFEHVNVTNIFFLDNI